MRVLRALSFSFSLAFAVAASPFWLGCDFISNLGPGTCDRSKDNNPPVKYTEGTVENGIYTSAPLDSGDGGDGGIEDDLLYFPGGMRYQIMHHLGAKPRSFELLLSFSRGGLSDGASLAQAAGNQAEVTDITDEHLIVANTSCSSYWLLVIADAGSDETPDAGAP